MALRDLFNKLRSFAFNLFVCCYRQSIATNCHVCTSQQGLSQLILLKSAINMIVYRHVQSQQRLSLQYLYHLTLIPTRYYQ